MENYKVKIFKFENNSLKLSSDDVLFSNDHPKNQLFLGYNMMYNVIEGNLKNINLDEINVIFNIDNIQKNTQNTDNVVNTENISNIANTLFKNIDTKIEISNAFLKYWEMFIIFDLINLNETNKITIFGNSKITQSVVYYKTIYSKKNNDELNVFYKKKDDNFDILKKKFNINHKKIVYDKDILKSSSNFNFCIDSYTKDFKSIVKSTLNVLNNLDKDGNFVLKINNIFDTPTYKIVYILSTLFEEMFVYKPYFSKAHCSDKFIILKKYKKNNKEITKLLEKIINDKQTTDKYVIDLPVDNIPISYHSKILKINEHYNNTRYSFINNLVGYKNNDPNNIKYISDFKQANLFWISKFFPINTQDKNNVVKHFQELYI